MVGIETRRFVREMVFKIDKMLIEKFQWEDREFEIFWREVLKELGASNEQIKNVFVEVFGIESAIGDVIYSLLKERIIRDVTK